MLTTWKDFTEKVRIFLTVDGVRKGSFTQKYIDQVIKAAALDLQSFIPSLKPFFSHTYEYDDLTHTSTVSTGEFASPATKIVSVHIQRTTGINSRARVTYDSQQQKLPTTRVDDFPNVSFSSCEFEVRPPLIEDEKLLIRYTAEVSQFADSDLVPFEDRCAKLVGSYVKAHITREIDKDLQLYSSYMGEYAKERSIYYLDRQEYLPICIDDTQIVKYLSSTMSTQSKNVSAAENLFANDLVTLTADGARRAKAGPGYSADGFVTIDTSAGTVAVVYFEGVLKGTFNPGDKYYLSGDAGQITVSPPTLPGEISQFIGKAMSTTELNFEPDTPISL